MAHKQVLRRDNIPFMGETNQYLETIVGIKQYLPIVENR